MKLTVLGSGAALFDPTAPYRYPAAHLVETPSSHILLDAGLGVLPQITRLGLTVGDISVIAISHFHVDHFNIQPLLQRYFLDGKFAGKRAKLQILGPPGIAERVGVGFEQCGFSFDKDFLPNVDYQITEYNNKQPIQLGNSIVLTPFKTTHYALDAYALRLEVNGKILTYSGDTTKDQALIQAARSADIFLCEASAPVNSPSDTGHLNPADAALVAAQAKARQLVLTHYAGHDSVQEILATAQKSHFSGPISVATDLDEFMF